MLDITVAWAFITTHRITLLAVILGLLLFGTGWQLGRVTSPYFTAHPIVFQDVAGVTSGGDYEALARLKAEGATVKQVATNTSGVQASGVPVAATSLADGPGISSTPDPTPTVGVTNGSVAGSTSRQFVGSKNSSLYHHVSCPSANRIKAENQVWWPTKEAAEAAGYTPSQCAKKYLGM